MIPQRRERLPALRAAVPAAREIPGHLNPRQMRVIPPSRPRPRPPLNALLPRRDPVAGSRRHQRHHRRQAAPDATSPTTARTASAAEPPGQPAAAPTQRPAPHHAPRSRAVLLRQPTGQLRQPPVRLQRLSQHHFHGRRPSTLRIPDHASRNRHAAQQTPSAAANHPEHRTSPEPPNPWRQVTPSHEFRVQPDSLGGYAGVPRCPTR